MAWWAEGYRPSSRIQALIPFDPITELHEWDPLPFHGHEYVFRVHVVYKARRSTYISAESHEFPKNFIHLCIGFGP